MSTATDALKLEMLGERLILEAMTESLQQASGAARKAAQAEHNIRVEVQTQQIVVRGYEEALKALGVDGAIVQGDASSLPVSDVRTTP